ncbi:unnamed protein product [Darwinula stevensoni]|uniref:Fe2OG dioxygenase domain-containing protein n=1 Tax=Darwinula stevensoni TaxID=69355 RepID=A0A7R9A523_9CRUS|nr:unnamed protein product [Darwinula stevensoni]CAG0885523.1 unnamed protein product [Darwinula stevensoni]
MQEALKRFHEEDMPTIAREDILEYLAFSTYMQGKTEEALQLTDELLKLMPHHPRAPGNKIYYEEELVKLKKTRKGDDGSPNISAQPELTPSEDAEPEEEEESERSVYEKLCRGEVSPSPKILASTYCTYFDHNRHPLLVIGPLKLEVMYPKPWIVIFRNFLQENEMEIIKQLAQPRLKRATVQNYKSGELETATYRISKSAWLRTEEHPVIEKIVRRIDAATDLDVETAEELQVVNYGLGGHYEPHFDFARMSDVSAGGATVFPELRLSLWPQKGSSAFWFNLHKSGEGDMKTRHAACPVLAGSKWGE